MAPIFDRSLLKIFARAGTVGMHMVASTFVGYLIGSQLDKWLGTQPWFTIIFLMLGIAAGYRELIKLARRTSKEDD